MSGSASPPSVFMVEKATVGFSRTSLSVSMKALRRPSSCRRSHGRPVRAPGAPSAGPAEEGTPAAAGGAPAVANSGNWASGSHVLMPSRQPRSVGAKRAVFRPSLTSSSGKIPRVVPLRLMWISAMPRVLVEAAAAGQSRTSYFAQRVAAVRKHEVEHGTDRHEAGRVNGFMRHVIMMFDVLEVYGPGDAWLLIEVHQIA